MKLIFLQMAETEKTKDIPEFAVCKKLGVKMVFDVGGNKIHPELKTLKPLLTISKKDLGRIRKLIRN